MYVNLNTGFFDKTRDKAQKQAIGTAGDSKSSRISAEYLDLKETIESVEVSEDGGISVGISTKLGYFLIDIPIDNELFERLLNVVIKRMNKIKTLIESLK